MNQAKGFYIGNEYLAPSGNIYNIRNPFNDEIVASIHMAQIEERERTVKLAYESFDEVSKISAEERINLLERFRDGIVKRSDEIAKTIALEAGKPIRYSKAEVKRALITIHLAIEAVRSPKWEHIPINASHDDKWQYGIIQRFPIGPVLGITPFNFPINLVMHKLAPAIAAGCPFILKPASQVSSTALILGDILNEIGTVPGQVSIVPMSAETANPLAGDDRIKLITFTGSDDVGWSIKSRCVKTRVSLELGGNAGCIIEPDTDLERATNRCLMGAFANQGQVCISLQRLYIHESIYDDFISSFVDKTSKLKYGDPLDETTDMGPVINKKEAERIVSWIDEASSKGGNVLCGGNRDGSIVQATIIENPSPDCKVLKDEVFGPVVVVNKYSDFDDAVESVGDTRYGLQAGIFTRDMEKAYRAYRTWQVGGVIVNDVPTFRVDAMPYGGCRDSGIGREGPEYAIEEMTETRIMVVNEP